MNEFLDIAAGTSAWVASFMSFGLLGVGLFYLLRPSKEQYWLYLEDVRCAVDEGRALPHRRALENTCVYRRGHQGIEGDAARLARRLLFFAFLALPGLGIALIGLIVYGAGLLAIPVLLIAVSGGRRALQLLSADPRFLGGAEQLHKDLRFAGGWCLLVAAVVSLPSPIFAVILAPIFVVGLVAWSTSKLVEPAAAELRACLLNRGLEWVDES